MTLNDVMTELEGYADERTKTTFLKHGAKEPYYGVKVGDLKKITKKTKKNHELSLALYNTGNSDAMYLAGLIADEKQMSKEQLKQWAKEAYWYMISEYTVAWVASETEYATELGLEWIDEKDDNLISAGWSTLSSHCAITPDENLDIELYSSLLDRVGRELQSSPNRARYTMNNFVIAVGTYITSLTDKANSIAEKIGKVNVEMGGTACKVPPAGPYLQKQRDMNRLGKKRKMARC